MDDDFYMQLTAEKQITRFVKGYPVLDWVKVRARNEGLDTTVYAYAAALRAGLATIDWKNFNKPKRKPRVSYCRPNTEVRRIRYHRPDWLDR